MFHVKDKNSRSTWNNFDDTKQCFTLNNWILLAITH